MKTLTEDELRCIESVEIDVVKDGKVEVSWIIKGKTPEETRRITDKVKARMVEAGYEDKTTTS